jgi:hypothetical protein
MRYWLVTVSLRLLTPLETGLLITFMIFLPQPSLPMTLFIVAANNLHLFSRKHKVLNIFSV